jgi:hypothetical protein
MKKRWMAIPKEKRATMARGRERKGSIPARVKRK